MAVTHPPARLRAELDRARQDGASFRAAWTPALRAALADAPHRDRAAWRDALRATKQVWHHSFTRTPGPGEGVGGLLD